MKFCGRFLSIATILLACVSLEAADGPRIIEHEMPATLEAGSITTVPIVLANDGPLSWCTADDFAISYHWLDADREVVIWDGRRTSLPETVAPGGSRRPIPLGLIHFRYQYLPAMPSAGSMVPRRGS